MTENPLVSVLVLCYNQAKFVGEAIRSALAQTYSPIQVIVFDDGSIDGSVNVIERALVDQPSVLFYKNETNQGYTKTLNKALSYAKGEFLIDLAADDVLMSTRIEKGVEALKNAGQKVGLNFSDAQIIDEEGKFLRLHSECFPHFTIPEGDVYQQLIKRYFICPPTMMFRKAVIDQLGGYDDSLSFEDFDFLVRAARNFDFCYTPIPLVKRRLVSQSMSQKQFRRGDPQRLSTYRVCEKIDRMNKTAEEVRALRKRIRFEFMLSLRMGDVGLAAKFFQLYFRLSSPNTMLT